MDTHPDPPAWTVAVINQKGGVGKTATTLNLGGALALFGHRVLIVDFDPQGHLSDAAKVLGQSAPGAGLAEALLGKLTAEQIRRLPVEHSVSDNGGRLDIIGTADEMFLLGPALYQAKARELRLRRVLAHLADRYDFILIDCPPSLDVLADNALAAANGVLIPVQLEDSTIRALRLLFAQVEAVEADLRDDRLTIHGLVPCMVERGAGGVPRSNIARSVLESLEALGLPILPSVPRGVPVTQAWRSGNPLAATAPDSEHAEAFALLAKVLMQARPLEGARS